MSTPAAPVLPTTLGRWVAELRMQRWKQRPAGSGRGVSAPQPWSRADLAAAVGVSESTLYRIEMDRELPQPRLLAQLTHALGLEGWRATLLRNFWIGAHGGLAAIPPSPRWTRLVQRVTYPALLLDELWYVRAWNLAAGDELRLLLGVPPVRNLPRHAFLAALEIAHQRRGVLAPDLLGWLLCHFLCETAISSSSDGYADLLTRIAAHPGFAQAWARLASADPTREALPFAPLASQRTVAVLRPLGAAVLLVLLPAPPASAATLQHSWEMANLARG